MPFTLWFAVLPSLRTCTRVLVTFFLLLVTVGSSSLLPVAFPARLPLRLRYVYHRVVAFPLPRCSSFPPFSRFCFLPLYAFHSHFPRFGWLILITPPPPRPVLTTQLFIRFTFPTVITAVRLPCSSCGSFDLILVIYLLVGYYLPLPPFPVPHYRAFVTVDCWLLQLRCCVVFYPLILLLRSSCGCSFLVNADALPFLVG